MSYKLLIITFIILFSSCQYDNTMNYESYSRRIVSDEVYDIIFKQATDSIENWVNKELSLFTFKKYNRGFLLDRLICFNNSKDKFVGALLINHNKSENATLDDIWFIYGAKIKDTWYFFQGADITLPREMYQKDITKPLSFEKLHEIALKEVFSGYLKKKKTWKFWKPAEWEVNERFFDQICPRAVGGRHFGTFIHFEDAVKCSSKGKWVKDYEKELPECNKDPFQYPIFGTEGYYDFVYEKDLKWLIQKGYCDKNGQLIKKYTPKFNRP